jgi:tetratricopeptide (TPR) repeat protein
MKKFSSTFLVAGVLFVSAMQAQSVQDGVKDLYAERYKGAKATFEKLVASNPNNIEANYWLGQTFLETNDVAGAKNVYTKALASSANAPLLLVGMGQVELKENKVSEARQRFESAITMTRGKKGDDPVILNAVGRAITESYNPQEKTGGDINYAVEKLQAAVQRDAKNPEYFLNLGDAIREAKPGEAGGLAFQNYQRAIEVDAKFAPAHHRLAQLFNSQRNWELYEKYLNDAVNADPRFAPAYYDLYYFKLLNKQDFNAAEEFAKKFVANTDPDPQNDYLRCQTIWAKKDFDGAISCAQNIASQNGAKTKAIVYKLIGDSYLQKKDTVQAKDPVLKYFAVATPEELKPADFKMKAAVYSVIPGMEDSVFIAFTDGLKADTIIENKINLLKEGAAWFKAKGQREKEGDLLSLLTELSPKPSINEMFDVGRAYYFGGAYIKSYSAFTKFAEKYPDEVYGWEWKLNNAKIIDSTKQDSIAVPDALKLLEFSQRDSTKFQKQYISAASYLALYYANKAGDKEKAIEYLKRWQTMDPVNKDAIQKNIDILSKASMRRENSTATKES